MTPPHVPGSDRLRLPSAGRHTGRRRATAACVLLTLLAGATGAFAAAAPADDAGERQLTLLVTSGLSGQLVRGDDQTGDDQTVAALAAEVERLAAAARADGRAVAVFDAGRTLVPYAESRFDGGQTMMRVLRAAGCQALAPAPIDFAVGLPRLADLAQGVGVPVLRPYAADAGPLAGQAVLAADGVELALVNLFDPFYAGDLAAAGVDAAPAEPAAALTDAPAGALRVGVVHSHAAGTSITTRRLAWDLLEGAAGFDLLIDPDLGQDLVVERRGDGGTVVLIGRQQRPEETWTVAEISLALHRGDGGRGDGRWRIVAADLEVHGVAAAPPADPTLAAEVRAAFDRFQAANAEPLPDAAPTDREGLERFVLQAVREATDAEVVILSRGALRPVDPKYFAETPLRRETVLRLLSLDQQLVVGELTGADLTALAGESVQRVRADGTPRQSSLRFLGLTFDVKDPGTPAAEVTGLQINARPLYPEDRYRVVTNSYLASGGDGYPILAEMAGEVVRTAEGERLEPRDDVVLPRLARAEEEFVNLAGRGLWRFGVDELAVYFTGVQSNADPAYGGVSDSRARAEDSTSLLAALRLRADQEWATLRWENRLRARYGVLETGDDPRDEIEDDLRLDVSGIFKEASWLGAHPFASMIFDTELRPDDGPGGTRLPRQRELSLAGGLSWRTEIWPRLRLGLVARRQDDFEDTERYGALGEAELAIPAAGWRPGIRGRLFVESLEDSAATIRRLDLDLGLSFAVTGAFTFTPALNYYVYDDSRLPGAAEYYRLSLGLSYTWHGKLQRR